MTRGSLIWAGWRTEKCFDLWHEVIMPRLCQENTAQQLQPARGFQSVCLGFISTTGAFVLQMQDCRKCHCPSMISVNTGGIEPVKELLIIGWLVGWGFESLGL